MQKIKLQKLRKVLTMMKQQRNANEGGRKLTERNKNLIVQINQMKGRKQL